MAMYRTIRIDFKAYDNNHLNVVMLSVMSNLTRAFLLNYPEFPDSSIFLKLCIRINFLNMLIDCTNINIIPY